MVSYGGVGLTFDDLYFSNETITRRLIRVKLQGSARARINLNFELTKTKLFKVSTNSYFKNKEAEGLMAQLTRIYSDCFEHVGEHGTCELLELFEKKTWVVGVGRWWQVVGVVMVG